MEQLHLDELISILEYISDLTNLSLVSKRYHDVVSFARERNLTKSKREHFLKVDKMLKENTQFLFLKSDEFIWRDCEYQDDLGFYVGSTQRILANGKLSNESTFTVASVFGTTLLLTCSEFLQKFQNYDSDIDIFFNVIHLMDCAKKTKFYDKHSCIFHWGKKRFDFRDLSNIKVLEDDLTPRDTQESAVPQNFFPNSLRCIKESYVQKPFNNGLFITTISELGLFVCDQNDNKLVELPIGSKFFCKLMDGYALIIVPKIDEISTLCLIDVDSIDVGDTPISLTDFPSTIKPDVVIYDKVAFIKCQIWYQLTISKSENSGKNYHQIRSFNSHINDYPVICPVNGIEWIPSRWYLMEKNNSMKLSQFEKLDGCSLS